MANYALLNTSNTALCRNAAAAAIAAAAAGDWWP